MLRHAAASSSAISRARPHAASTAPPSRAARAAAKTPSAAHARFTAVGRVALNSAPARSIAASAPPAGAADAASAIP